MLTILPPLAGVTSVDEGLTVIESVVPATAELSMFVITSRSTCDIAGWQHIACLFIGGWYNIACLQIKRHNECVGMQLNFICAKKIFKGCFNNCLGCEVI